MPPSLDVCMICKSLMVEICNDEIGFKYKCENCGYAYSKTLNQKHNRISDSISVHPFILSRFPNLQVTQIWRGGESFKRFEHYISNDDFIKWYRKIRRLSVMS